LSESKLLNEVAYTRYEAQTVILQKLPIVYAAVLIVGAAAISMAVYRGYRESQLLRADPDTVPGNDPLMQFAATRGAARFRVHCASCHGASGKGDPLRATPDLTDDDWLFGTGTVSEIERVIAYGIRSNHPKAWNLARMPGFARPHPSPADPKILPLSPGDIRDVVEYLIHLQKGSADSAAASRGERIYGGAGGCFDCHTPDGRGDAAIGAPNLTDAVTLYGGSRQALFDSVADGRQGVCPAWADQINAAAVREIALFVYSLSHTSHR
jgi:cytochrome c oxidase cbb3-type subunit III